jgi:hypothetical protein
MAHVDAPADPGVPPFGKIWTLLSVSIAAGES